MGPEVQGHSQKWPREGVLRVGMHCGHSPDRHFVTILVKIIQNFGYIPAKVYGPLHSRGGNWRQTY